MAQQQKIQPQNSLQHLMASPVGEVLSRSWTEKPILSSLKHWYFPLSRLWAAARSAGTDLDKFYASVPMAPPPGGNTEIQQLLQDFAEKRAQILSTEQAWRQQFFSPNHCSLDELQVLEQQRLEHRNQYNATRQGFHKLRKYVSSSVYDQFATPSEVAARYSQDPVEFETAFEPPVDMPEVEVSHAIPGDNSHDYWIRFASPSAQMGDTVYARVLEPKGVKNPPTLIFGHGIGVEFDHWRNMVDIVKFFPQLGIRVIRPEAPWHGRRVPDGFYGGEYFLASTPMGSFDFFTAQHQEWAVLADWARRTSSGPLAMGGSSLGAQSAQMTSIRANHWPSYLRPDALFLMTHCAHMWEVALDGDLADIWGLHKPLKKLGWDRKIIERWMQKLDPQGEPCVDPANIVSVLGRSDGVTPYRSGRRLQNLWELPPQNCFSWPCGHFSVPLRMVRHQQPLFRLKAIFDQLQRG